MNFEGLILAAGLSSRMGSFKMDLKLGDSTVLRRTIDSMIDFCSRIIVVGGNQYNSIIGLANDYEKVEIVLNDNYKLGMFSSIQKGLENIAGDWLFFLPGDCPFINPGVYGSLIEASKKNEYNIYVPTAYSQKGHPVLIKSSLAEDILSKPIDYNLKDYIRKKGYGKVEVADEGILFDVDTEDDYKKALLKV